jgi:hypothetical protein
MCAVLCTGLQEELDFSPRNVFFLFLKLNVTTNTFDFSMQNGLYMSRLQLPPWTANALMLQRIFADPIKLLRKAFPESKRVGKSK